MASDGQDRAHALGWGGGGSTLTDLRTFAREHAPYHKKRQMFLSAPQDRNTPNDTPTLVVLVAAGLIGTGKAKGRSQAGQEAPTRMIEAGVPTTGPFK